MKFLHQRGFAALVALMLMLGPVVANGQPVLIAERDIHLGGGRLSSGLVPPITQVGFELMFGPSAACPANSFLGCQPMFTPGQTGVFDFNASNAINFGNMVSRFTDEIDEGSLSMEYNLYDVSSTLIGGVGSGGTESQKFGGLLTGRTIDFFRLTVHINSVENFPAGNGFDSRADFTWQVWGSGTPIPNPRPPVPVTAIPEPEMYAMMLAGLGVLGFVARRKKRQAAAA